MPPKNSHSHSHSHNHALFKPHINFRDGNLNIGARSDIKVGGLHIGSSSNTRVGKDGYQHIESSHNSISGLYSNTSSKKETSNFIRHSTSESQTSIINGISQSSHAESKTSTWTSRKEEQSSSERINNIYATSAHQRTELSLRNGYSNEWSTTNSVGNITSALSHSVHVDKHGVHGADNINLNVGKTPLVHITVPPVILGGKAPAFQSTHNNKPPYNANPSTTSRDTFSGHNPRPNTSPIETTGVGTTRSEEPALNTRLMRGNTTSSSLSQNTGFSIFCCFNSRSKKSGSSSITSSGCTIS